MPIFEIETDQGVFEIDADREPTMEEALQAISTQSAPPEVKRDLSVVTPEFREQYMAEAQKPITQRLSDAVSSVVTMPMKAGEAIGKQLWNAAKGGVEGAAEMIGEEAARVEYDPAQIFSSKQRLAGQVAQSGLEAGARMPADVIRSIPDLANLVPGKVLGDAILPKDTSEAAIEAAFQKQVADEAFDQVRSEGLAPEIFGKKNEKLTEGIETFAPVPAIGPAKIAKGVGAAVKGTAKLPGQILRGAKNTGAQVIADSPAIRPIVQAAENRGLRASSENLGATVFDIPQSGTKNERWISSVESGRFAEDLDEIRKANKSPQNYPELINASKDTVSNLGDEITGFIKPNANVAVNNSNVGAAGRGVISQLDRRDYPQAVAKIEERAQLFDAPSTLKGTFDELKHINEKVASYYRKSEAGQATYLDDLEHAADLAMRDQLSANADDLFRGMTKVDRNPFRLYGRVSERLNQAESAYNKVRTGAGKRVTKGSKPMESIGEIPVRATRKVVQIFKGGEVDAANANVRKMFQRTPKGPPPAPLSPSQAQALTGPRTSIPPPIPGSAPAALDLDQAISAALAKGNVPGAPGGVARPASAVPQIGEIVGPGGPVASRQVPSEVGRVMEAADSSRQGEITRALAEQNAINEAIVKSISQNPAQRLPPGLSVPQLFDILGPGVENLPVRQIPSEVIPRGTAAEKAMAKARSESVKAAREKVKKAEEALKKAQEEAESKTSMGYF